MARCTVFFELSSGAAQRKEAYGELGRERAAELARLFAHTNVTVLELAATIDWLWREEKHRDWQSEITKRKSLKVRHGRLERAVDLLAAREGRRVIAAEAVVAG